MILNTLQCTGTAQQRIIQPPHVHSSKVEKPCIASTNPSHQEFKILADLLKTEPGKGTWAVTSHSVQQRTIACLPLALSPALGPSPPTSHVSWGLQILLLFFAEQLPPSLKSWHHPIPWNSGSHLMPQGIIRIFFFFFSRIFFLNNVTSPPKGNLSVET